MDKGRKMRDELCYCFVDFLFFLFSWEDQERGPLDKKQNEPSNIEKSKSYLDKDDELGPLDQIKTANKIAGLIGPKF